MTRYVLAYLRHRRAPADPYYAWAAWDASLALTRAAWPPATLHA